jgi:hypothetical protein
LNPYFSKSSIRRFEDRIQNTVGKLIGRLIEAGKIGEILPIKLAFKAATVYLPATWSMMITNAGGSMPSMPCSIWHGR